ncbi:hypothetical protein Hanom_Chr09g00852061 [Helianthus anomalus]
MIHNSCLIIYLLHILYSNYSIKYVNNLTATLDLSLIDIKSVTYCEPLTILKRAFFFIYRPLDVLWLHILGTPARGSIFKRVMGQSG